MSPFGGVQKEEHLDITGELCGLLEQKKGLFLEYEQATLALLDCAPEDAEKYIILRGQKATEIDELTETIARLCSQAPDPAVLLEAAGGKVDFERVPSEYHPVFYAAQGVFSVIHRIRQSDIQAMGRLAKLRDEAREAIRQNQNLPKIKKYLTDLTNAGPPASLKDEKV